MPQAVKHLLPDSASPEWRDWRWQMRNQAASLAEIFEFLPDLAHRPAASGCDAHTEAQLARHFRTAVTPYYLSLVDPADPRCPILAQILPDPREIADPVYENPDPQAEETHMAAPGLIHRYPDRALWYLSHRCAVYCRFCFRKRKVSHEESAPARNDYESALAYIRAAPQLREVILSGGDPLSLSDERLAWILDELRAIPQLASIRIHTRMPVTLPMRITAALCGIFERAYPLTLVTHFNHAREISEESRGAVRRLRLAGVSVLNQHVLLAGINDSVEAHFDLITALLRAGVTPYLMHRCDETRGVSHFRAPIERGLEILAGLRGRLPGYAIPRYVVDLPGGGGKIPLEPDFRVAGPLPGKNGGRLFRFRNYAGRVYEVQD